MRKYGAYPISVVVLHGGPGAIGEMAPMAQRLSSSFGVLEYFQKRLSIEEELLALKTVVEQEATAPIVLIGYSFGAWMSCLFAARFPALVRKVVLIGCPPFEDRYAPSIMETRLVRMGPSEKAELAELKKQLSDPLTVDRNALLARLGKFFRKVDSFDLVDEEGDVLTGDFTVYDTIWREAQELRHSGALLRALEHVACPITALHGERDPHPLQGAFEPLTRLVCAFKGIVLKECGHTPWIERKAGDHFFDVLREEIQN